MKTIILDDELHSAESLFLLLKKYCPETEVLSIETDPETGAEKIRALAPDLLFLDIDLKTTNVFEVLRTLGPQKGLIFTTAHDNFDFAKQAINFDAIAYLLKPVDSTELVKAVEKAKYKFQQMPRISAPPPAFIERISVPTTDGLIFLHLESIVRFEGDGSYATAFLTDGSELVISKHLGAVERMVRHSTFSRVHKRHLVNRFHLKQYFRGEGGEVLLSNGDRIPISRDRRDDFLQNFKS